MWTPGVAQEYQMLIMFMLETAFKALAPDGCFHQALFWMTRHLGQLSRPWSWCDHCAPLNVTFAFMLCIYFVTFVTARILMNSRMWCWDTVMTCLSCVVTRLRFLMFDIYPQLCGRQSLLFMSLGVLGQNSPTKTLHTLLKARITPWTCFCPIADQLLPGWRHSSPALATWLEA